MSERPGFRARFAVHRRDVAAFTALQTFLLVYLSPFWLKNDALFKIGNDFSILYANYATYWVDAVRSGFLPLWNPNEACGYPFHSNPFTAFFYPGKVLFLFLSARAPVYSWYHHQLFMVMGVCLLAAGLYVWLRGRGHDPAAALFAAGAVTIGYRVADIYRFPNAVHAAAWMPWILYAYDRWIDREIGRGLLLGIFSLFCLATAGYPYYAVYAAMLIASYVVLRIAEGVPKARALVAIASLSIPAACLAAPYYSSMSRLLAQTVDRAGSSYSYSTQFPWSYVDLLGGLIFPPSAMSEGWLYFGLVPLLMVLVWAVVRRPSGVALLWVVGLTLGVHLIAAGAQSFLFPAFWTYAPGIRGLRFWPRITIILLPAFALLFALAYSGLEAASVRASRRMQRGLWRIALFVAAVQFTLWMTKTFSTWWPFFSDTIQPVMFVMATFIAASYLTFWAYHRARATVGWAVLALLVTASDTGIYGRQIWRAAVGTPVPTESLDLAGYYGRYFSIPRTPVPGMGIPYSPQSGLLENWYYERYASFLSRYADRPGFTDFLGAGGRKVFFSPTLDAQPENFEQWWREVAVFEKASRASAVRVGSYNGNALRLRYAISRPGHLIFVDNWDADWRATRNGASVPIELAFGTFKAVPVGAGTGLVTFDYAPRPPRAWTVLLGIALVIAVIAVEIFRRRRERPIQIPAEIPAS